MSISAFPSTATSPMSAPPSSAASSSSVAAMKDDAHLCAEQQAVVLKTQQLAPRIYQQSSSGSQCDRGLEKMTPEEVFEMNQILGRLSGGADYDINLTKLLSKKAGQIEEQPHGIEDRDLTRLRELVNKAIGHNIGWDDYHADERALRSGDQLFAAKGTVLTNFAPNQNDRVDAHLKTNLATGKALKKEDHELIDRRYNCGSTSMQLFIKRLEQMKERRQDAMKHNALSQLSGPERIGKIDEVLGRMRPKSMKELESSGKNPDDHNSSSLKAGAVLMEAITPLNLNGMDTAAKKEAVERKEARWGEAIDRRNGSEPFGECNWWFGKSEYTAEKDAFKKDGAVAGIEQRIDYEVLGNKKRAGQELFFIQLQRLQAAPEATDDDIRKLVNSSLFDLVTTGLHSEDKEDLRKEVLSDALMVREIAQSVTRDNAASDQETQKAATTAFDQAFATKLQEKAEAGLTVKEKDDLTKKIANEKKEIEEEEKKTPLYPSLPWKKIPVEILNRL